MFQKVTKEFLESMTKKQIIEFIEKIIDERNKKEDEKFEDYQRVLEENQILKNRLQTIQKIAGGNVKIPATLNTALADQAFGRE